MVWLRNDKGELLLARRADHKKQDPGLWGPSVTGKVERGETFEQAAIREAEEELCLKPGTYTLTHLFPANFMHLDGELRKFEVFVATITDDTIKKITFDTNEVAELKWLPLNEVRNLLTTKPGEVIVASAFVLWKKIFDALEQA